MTPADLEALLDTHFANWVKALTLSVTTSDESGVIVRMPLEPEIMRIGDIVCGQALATLADTSMTLAAVAHAGAYRPLATTDLHTQFLRPGTGSAILCHAQITRSGRALAFARADMREETSGKLVATASATFFLV